MSPVFYAGEVSVLGNDDFATYVLIAMGFAYLALILPSRLDRLTNIIAAAIFGVLQAIMLVDGITAYPDATFNLMTGATVLIMASIVWLAFRWPKEARTGSSEVEAPPMANSAEPVRAEYGPGAGLTMKPEWGDPRDSAW